MRLARCLAITALIVRSATPQQYSHLSGLIRDPTEALVANASVFVINEDTGFRRSTVSRPDGGYVVASLQPGTYKITVHKDGFRTVIQLGVKLDVAQPARVDFTLPLGSQQDVLTVEGQRAPVNAEDASVGTLVGREHVEHVPNNGRGLQALLELAPGTLLTPATRGEAGQFSVNGQRPNTNYFTVDGVSGNNGVSGGGSPAQPTGGSLPGMTALGSLHGMIPLESLDEFRIQTSTTAPEFGRLPGAQVSMNSRSGTNELHGSGFYYMRHDALDANDWFANRAGEGKAPLRVQDIGGSLGGPLRRNKTFYFLSYEGMRLRQPFAWRTPSPTAEARQSGADYVRAALNLFPIPNGPALGNGLAEWTGRNERPARLDSGGARVDHGLTSRVTVFGRYQETPSSNEFGSSQISSLNIRSRGFTMGANVRPFRSTVFDIRWGYAYTAADSNWRSTDPGLTGSCPLEPVTFFFFRLPGLCDYLFRIQISGVGQGAFGLEPNRSQAQWHFVPAGGVTIRSHQLRIGADYRKLSPMRQDRGGSIAIIADSLKDLVGNSNLWLATSPQIRGEAKLTEASLYAQDTWQVARWLTATYGLRAEFSPVPETTVRGAVQGAFLFPGQESIWAEDRVNLAPRVGVAISPFRGGNTVVRGGYGIYYNSSLSIGTDLLNGGPFTLAQYTSGRNGFVATLLRFGFQPDLRLPLIRQWNVSFEHALRGRDIFSLSYVASNGARLLRREIGPGSTDTFQLALATNNGRSDYHGVQFQYRRKLAQGLQANVHYAVSKSTDDTSSDSSLNWSLGGLTAAADRGPSDFDVRQNFHAALTYDFTKRPDGPRWRRLANDWSLDAVVKGRTGFPITVLNAEQTNGLNFTNVFRPDLVAGAPLWIQDPMIPGGRLLNSQAFSPRRGFQQGNLGRNAISGFGMSQFDLALRRDFPVREHHILQLRIEAFNFLNKSSFADPIRYLANPLFGQAPSMLNLMLGTGSPGSGLTPIFQSGGPRSMQFVFRYRF
ncbi:MAG: TonB-dependent receptor [Candidatus Solibacter usitatus]|nr:TonB-dependent receptor [Candidatus Solibacter usitatus]